MPYISQRRYLCFYYQFRSSKDAIIRFYVLNLPFPLLDLCGLFVQNSVFAIFGKTCSLNAWPRFTGDREERFLNKEAAKISKKEFRFYSTLQKMRSFDSMSGFSATLFEISVSSCSKFCFRDLL